MIRRIFYGLYLSNEKEKDEAYTEFDLNYFQGFWLTKLYCPGLEELFVASG